MLIEFQIPNIRDAITNFEEYLEKMSRDTTWGDHVMLQVLANTLGRNICVVEADRETLLESQNLRYPAHERILLGYLVNYHYYSLEPGKANKSEWII